MRRRNLLRTALAVPATVAAARLAAPAAAAASPGAAPAKGPASAPAPAGSQDALAGVYYQALLLNTPFVESMWDPATGSYPIPDFYFVSVLGNAVLCTSGTYDAQAAGIERETLLEHTLSTIRYAAAHNRWNSAAGTWGKQLYFDSTMESYFVAAAKLLWPQLDAATRDQIDAIVRGTANYVVSLGTDPDPLSPGWTTNGLAGGYAGDSKMEEMGTRTMPLATALAWLPDDPDAGAWAQWLSRWTTNMSGLPPADRANPSPAGGTTIAAANQADNIWDTFLVENHGTYAPIYQQSIGAYPGRNVAQFLIAGRDVPAAVTTVPNADRLWFVMGQTGTDAGVPEDFMVADRHHLYGRNLLPLTYRAMVDGDRYVARAERMLADHLIPYERYAPAGRLTKFSGEPKYEPEARAETAMAYLLHYHRDRLAGDVRAASAAEYFAHHSGAIDYGVGPGLAVHQSARALAGSVTKPGYVKFAYLPQHDDWLFDIAGASPALLPSTATTVLSRTCRVYTSARDGIDATATVLRTPGGVAGFATLPDGTVAYASGGVGAGEGVLRLTNLSMPGIDGLDGDRTFRWAGGSVTLAPQTGLGDGGVDDIAFAATTARYLRMYGDRAATAYGFSLYELEVYGDGGTDLAVGATATASSYDSGNQAAGGPFPPALAVDGRTDTRWAVAPAQRPNPGWLCVDLGADHSVNRVVLRWETAYASQYRIEVSGDGQTWRTVAAVPATVEAAGNWLNVDGRAGFVVRGGTNPITVTGAGIVLSDGPAAGSAGMVIEGYPAQSDVDTARRAAAPAPSDLPAGLAASLVGGQLSVFNLTGASVAGEFTVPRTGPALVAYQGTQRVSGTRASRYAVDLPGADAVVAAARFTVATPGNGSPPVGLTVRVDGSRSLRLSAPAGTGPVRLLVRSLANGQTAPATVPDGGDTTVTFPHGPDVPTSDLARGATTYPTSPLPPGMSSPATAVDGDPGTSWRPGPDGRMVIDLGAAVPAGSVKLTWSRPGTPAVRVAVSTDGLTYTDVAALAPATGPTQQAPLHVTARYVAVSATGWRPGQATLVEAAILP
ncbi:discoidin domain-containing protein [Rugosimonospora africana]|uniref:F5/8 type C domain-containing protein n=1 Tax=Rugosimonospora africana TaxID=556532 RepID=A0A8J3QPU0_9ACTN|nr:discoidin domain-containing protein [Rugosimonospora africana]GIH14266.1 hypothetical protein Raf01_24380 [Rugosimonospora africana]